MASNFKEYEAQLKAVENALKGATGDSEKAELLSLKESLEELLALSKELETDNGEKEDESAEDEMQRFLKELKDLEDKPKEENCSIGEKRKEEDYEAQLQELRPKLEAMIGERCSAPHLHSWGAVAYHNAIICGIEDEVNIDDKGSLDVRVKVLFVNPTHKEMLPCKYFLEGECRFDEDRCHFSHGSLVSYNALKEYSAPEFDLLARNCVVLARLEDRVWHRGRVLCANFIEKNCRVRLESKEHKERERDFEFQDLFPIFHDDDLSSGSDDDSMDDSESDELDDYEAIRQARWVEHSLFSFKPTQPLGEWEKYTKGIGSKLMAKMGYIHGTGLGSDGRGIVVPITAQVLPQGRSLDHCMQLREAANGDKDLFSVEKKLRRDQKKQEALNAKAYAREATRVDVFSFLNDNVFSNGQNDSAHSSSSMKKNKKDLQEHSTKTLNVASVRIADDIRRKEREITKLEESMKRNASNKEMQKHLQIQLSSRNQELRLMKNDEMRLSKEQDSRKKTGKLVVF